MYKIKNMYVQNNVATDDFYKQICHTVRICQINVMNAMEHFFHSMVLCEE